MTDSKSNKNDTARCCPPGEPLPDWATECLSRLFSALGDPTRLTILRSLAEKDGDGQCVSDLAKQFPAGFTGCWAAQAEVDDVRAP